MDTSIMFDESLFALHCYITATSGETKNNQLKYFEVDVEHT